MLELQNRLPKARIVYASATGMCIFFLHINFNEILYSFVDKYFIAVLVLLRNVHGKGHSGFKKELK